MNLFISTFISIILTSITSLHTRSRYALF